jgi:hypothetical protein
MNRMDSRFTRVPTLGLTALALVAAVALALPASRAAVAATPDVTGIQLNGVPLTSDPGLTMGQLPGATTDAAPSLDGIAPDHMAGTIVRPTRVWTTDRYGVRRSTFARGESIGFWVQLYNPSRSFVRHPLELWADDQIRCITTPCPGGPQRLFSGVLSVRPGYTNYYMFARAERDDKVGEWSYYATDPQGLTHVATRFFLR